MSNDWNLKESRNSKDAVDWDSIEIFHEKLAEDIKKCTIRPEYPDKLSKALLRIINKRIGQKL